MQFPELKSLWTRTLFPKTPITDSSWNKELEHLFDLGISMNECLKYLFENRPDWETFEQWLALKSIDYKKNSATVMDNVLSQEDLNFWKENGYIVLKNAIPRSDCEATEKVIWEHLGMRKDSPETWYQGHKDQQGLMLSFSNHPVLNKNRNSSRIRKAYEQLYQSTDLFHTIDKVSFNPPENEYFRFLGDGLHWDVSLKLPIPFSLQGLLYLTDCGSDDGAFHCVPGFHREIEHWLKNIPATKSPRAWAPEVLRPQAIAGSAGDFIIWHQALPHCATPNKGIYPRMVQYLTYKKRGHQDASEWL